MPLVPTAPPCRTRAGPFHSLRNTPLAREIARRQRARIAAECSSYRSAHACRSRDPGRCSFPRTRRSGTIRLRSSGLRYSPVGRMRRGEVRWRQPPEGTTEPIPHRPLMPAIRPFERAHIEHALGLWRSTEYICLSSADEPEQLGGFLSRNRGCSFVALEQGQLVGACLCGHDGRRGYIYHLAVARSHRRGRLGVRLLATCLDSLREAGIRKCHAFVLHASPYRELFWQPAGWEGVTSCWSIPRLPGLADSRSPPAQVIPESPGRSRNGDRPVPVHARPVR